MTPPENITTEPSFLLLCCKKILKQLIFCSLNAEVIHIFFIRMDAVDTVQGGKHKHLIYLMNSFIIILCNSISITNYVFSSVIIM